MPPSQARPQRRAKKPARNETGFSSALRLRLNLRDSLLCLRGASTFRSDMCRLFDIHLTLVPPWNEASVPDAVAKLRQALEGLGRFSLTFERLCYGPQARRPRLLWVECMPSAEILALQNALLSAFDQTNERPFGPHVTLARIERNGGAVAKENPIDQALWLNQRVESVELF